jgi:hypothetical protein
VARNGGDGKCGDCGGKCRGEHARESHDDPPFSLLT